MTLMVSGLGLGGASDLEGLNPPKIELVIT